MVERTARVCMNVCLYVWVFVCEWMDSYSSYGMVYAMNICVSLYVCSHLREVYCRSPPCSVQWLVEDVRRGGGEGWRHRPLLLLKSWSPSGSSSAAPLIPLSLFPNSPSSSPPTSVRASPANIRVASGNVSTSGPNSGQSKAK